MSEKEGEGELALTIGCGVTALLQEAEEWMVEDEKSTSEREKDALFLYLLLPSPSPPEFKVSLGPLLNPSPLERMEILVDLVRFGL